MKNSEIYGFTTINEQELVEINGGLVWIPVAIAVVKIVAAAAVIATAAYVGYSNGYNDTKTQYR